MFLSLCLSWLGIGALVLSSPRRSERLSALAPRRWLLGPRRGWLRWPSYGAGWLLVLLSARPLAPGAALSLSLVAALLESMALASVAVLLCPARPRLYAVSLPLSAVGAALALLWG